MALPSSEFESPPPPPPSSKTTKSNGEDSTALVMTTMSTRHVYSNSLPTSDNPRLNEESRASKPNSPKSSKNYNLLLMLNYALLFVGSISSTLISKYYFIHKGSSKWVSTLVQSAGFPILFLPVYLPFVFGCTERRPFSGFTRPILIMSVGVGVMLGVNNLLISWGTAYLPVSTASLLLSSQLAFNLILSVIIVKQKVNFSNLNCVMLLTLGSVLLGLGSSHDKPSGLTQEKYWIGFFSTLGAGLLFALYLPVMEMIYRKVYCYAMVIEMQLVMEVAATVFAIIGMAADRGFSDMKAEAGGVFDKGPTVYWLTIAATVVLWQFCFVGTAGMVFLTTSLTGGVCMTALMAVNVVGGVVVYGDEFSGVKGVSTALCVWGFCSYLYGMYEKNVKGKSDENRSSTEMNEIM